MLFGKLLKLRRTVALRLAILYAGVFSFSAVSAFGISYFLIASALQERADRDLLTEARELLSVYEQKGIGQLKDAMVIESNSEGKEHMFLRLVLRGGEEFMVPDLPVWGDVSLGRRSLVKAMSGQENLLETEPLAGREHGVRVLTSLIGGSPGGVLQIGTSMENDQNLSGTCLRIFSVTTAVMVGFAGLVGFLIAKRALGGVVEVTETAAQISGGDFSRRVTVGGRGEEIDNLAGTFNRMIERIQALITRMGEMNDNIAHDLRTPITRIRGVLETTVMKSCDREEYEAMSGSIIEECDRLLVMINAMLDISEAEAGVAPLTLTDFDVSRIVRDACELFLPVAEDEHIRIIEHLTPNTFMRGDMLKVQQAVFNLMDNALKYTPEGGEVTVVVHGNGCEVFISIKDSGIGIGSSDLPRVFDRFFRGDRSRSHPGSGLGLSLARAFARAHGGDIRVESSPGQGAVFTITLPRHACPPGTPPSCANP